MFHIGAECERARELSERMWASGMWFFLTLWSFVRSEDRSVRRDPKEKKTTEQKESERRQLLAKISGSILNPTSTLTPCPRDTEAEDEREIYNGDRSETGKIARELRLDRDKGR